MHELIDGRSYWAFTDWIISITKWQARGYSLHCDHPDSDRAPLCVTAAMAVAFYCAVISTNLFDPIALPKYMKFSVSFPRVLLWGIIRYLHCALASCGAVYCNRSCLWVCDSGRAGSRAGERAVSEPYYSQHAQCLRLSERFFIFIYFRNYCALRSEETWGLRLTEVGVWPSLCLASCGIM